jgi:hypothetical protein
MQGTYRKLGFVAEFSIAASVNQDRKPFSATRVSRWSTKLGANRVISNFAFASAPHSAVTNRLPGRSIFILIVPNSSIKMPQSFSILSGLLGVGLVH